jgi:LPS-assembly protein
LFSPQSGLDTKWSDYILETEVSTGWIGAAGRLRIDPDDYKVERLEVDGFARIGPASVSATYYNLARTFTGGASSEYVRLGGTLVLSENFSVSYGIDRDLAASRTQQSNFGVTYQDDCLILTVSYVKNQGSITRSVQEFGGVFISIGLKTIGQFGIG